MNDLPETRTEHLLDHPFAVPIIADRFEKEWAPWYGPAGPGDAAADLLNCSDRDRLPICLIALDSGDAVLGTGALRATSLGSDVAPGPWLTGLLVAPQHRRRGVGSALVDAIEREAARLGFADIYTSTDSADRMMQRRGWIAVGQATSLRGGVTVFRKSL